MGEHQFCDIGVGGHRFVEMLLNAWPRRICYKF